MKPSRASKVLGRNPSDFTSLYYVVRHLRASGRDEEALSRLRAGLAVEPTSVFALREAAQACVALGRHDEGEAYVRDAIRADLGGLAWWVDSLFAGMWRVVCLLKRKSLPLPELPSVTVARDAASWKAWAEQYLLGCRARREASQQ